MTPAKRATKKLTRTESTVQEDQKLEIHMPKRTRSGIVETDHRGGQVKCMGKKEDRAETADRGETVGTIHTMTTFMEVNYGF